MSGFKSLAVAGAFVALTGTNALSTDLFRTSESPPLANQEKLEFGTGWYLRGDIGWAREKAPSFAADGTLGGVTKMQNSWSLSVGGGYKFNSWFRTDLTFDYRKELNANMTSGNFTCYNEIRLVNDVNGNPVGVHAVEDQCRSSQTGRVNRSTVLANAYIDLGNWSGVTPYIGAGVGTTYVNRTGSYDWLWAADGTHYGPTLTLPDQTPIPTLWFDNNGNVIAQPVNAFGVQDHRKSFTGRNFNLAWALMAGLAYDISPNAKIDLGYRYLNLGKFSSTSKANVINEYRIGVRYMID